MPHILLVEDDAVLRKVLRDLLVRDGHTVVVAANGVDALRHLGTETFDVVISDLIMPELEGIQLVRTLRMRDKPPPIIAMSGGGRGSSSTYLQMARRAGAAVTLSKPFTAAALSQAITEALTSGADPAAH